MRMANLDISYIYKPAELFYQNHPPTKTSKMR